MEAIVETLKQYASQANEAARKGLISTLFDLAYSLEDVDDTTHRVGYLPLQTAAVRTGIDLKLFNLLDEAKIPLKLHEIAERTGADVVFSGRLLRFLATHGYVKETDKDEFTANKVTKNLTMRGPQAGVCHIFDTCGPQYMEMPRFLRKVKWQDQTDSEHTVFQDAFNTHEGAFEWFTSHPDNLKYFNDYMDHRRQGSESWLSVYPVEEEIQGWNPADPVFVNIGGSIGHQCAQFKERYPNVPGRVVLQDLPHTIENALQTQGVENMVHNFFDPQPIKGARFYYFRGVMHNHPDNKCRIVLENTKAAMGKDSVLLIDEMVLPDKDVPPQPISVDLTMMCAMAARERTESQWKELLRSAGLKLIKSYTYKAADCETVMAVVPQER